MSYLHGDTVTLTVRTRNGTDADGNDRFSVADQVLHGVPCWPTTASELTQQGFAAVRRDTTITGVTAMLPVGTDVEAIDAVTVAGRRYEVDGEPGRYRSPYTGHSPGVLVRLIRVEG